jgi:DNA-binding transcriptional LysR family regulator
MLDPPTTGRYMVTRLASFRFYLYAAPDYLARHPPIRQQADLAQHYFADYVQDRLASRELSSFDELGFTPRRRLCCRVFLPSARSGWRRLPICTGCGG